MRFDHMYRLGVKELRALARDPMLLLFIVFAFTFSIYSPAASAPETLNRAPIAIVDEDQSPLSMRIGESFYPPYFLPPVFITASEMDEQLDAGTITFALNIPPNFQRDVLAGRSPQVQLNIDATRVSQAFNGGGYVQQIVSSEVTEFVNRYRVRQSLPVNVVERVRFNQQLNKSWFTGVMKLIDQVTLLSIILTGAALIRERERGTIEHLLVMPVTPLEIMAAKVWSMGLVVLVATAFSLFIVIRGWLAIPIQGSIPLFLTGTAMHLFATTSMGIFMATFTRSMPQFGLLLMLILMPLQMLSGGSTPRESMPLFVQNVMLAAPTTHFVSFSQGVLYRGAGLATVWPQLAFLAVIGGVLFTIAQRRLRSTLGSMA
ncbi:Inner membrane transport permease YhhJ [Caulifigura coniformis]|uniref:Inner membrane transport permease YhhJ n=1 Tax=Caulifigura coniformis TaxID=2527983 RepID=A0A517SAB4_9PLAN|nr:ABC transporter permease [Caulifigura coniformis]QDT53069.1 Inner membrane transport permease YhhJ [Caulifigura coniformis]